MSECQFHDFEKEDEAAGWIDKLQNSSRFGKRDAYRTNAGLRLKFDQTRSWTVGMTREVNQTHANHLKSSLS
jgi:hypothetical protein